LKSHYSPSNMKPNKRLRVLRAEHGLSQRDTAVKAKLALDRYWRIENGYAEPTPEERERLAGVFAVEVPDAFPPVSGSDAVAS
jgi:transcriptional regulator with XRE-family HTH domain